MSETVFKKIRELGGMLGVSMSESDGELYNPSTFSSMIRALKRSWKSQQEIHNCQSQLLWDAYMILDHGEHDERLAMLSKLEKHFSKVGKPTKNNYSGT
ncbi:hypothetical protein TUMSATVNIG1_59650 (plasmid) [Vibrio nigripulchritudo]|uniref:hypothetical protein n=1 Tax=Vibrio nigripulchritudo TaxID=28173 RepID=UPI00190945FA|nr:hypothetical protein [Vibrio nigripulchritudo]BCL73979.1 hypothetical protein VNTUMSATTG_59160 [Vibrio nigripulchritudo]BDU35356.1 hypothetical protein TUMSATVNIG1_59650 [Vibrio nigripulchritudo]